MSGLTFQSYFLLAIIQFYCHAMPVDHAPPSNVACPLGGVLSTFDKKACYAYIEEPSNLGYQGDICNEQYSYENGPYGYVVFSKSALENAYLQDFLKTTVKDLKKPIWLGAVSVSEQYCNYYGCTGSGYYWTWQDNTNITYTNFAPGQSGAADGGVGIAMIPETGYWSVESNAKIYATVCQYAASKA